MNSFARRILSLYTFRQLALIFALSLLFAPVQASDLDAATVKSFIASMKAVQTEVMETAETSMEEDFGPEGDMDMDFSKAFSNMVNELDNHSPTQKQVSDIVDRYGFDNLDEWGNIGDRIFTAYMAISMEGQPVMDMSGMGDYMAAMEYLPEAEQENIRRMMEGAQQANQAARNAPKADIEAVRPFADDIMMFQEMDDR